MLKNFSTQGLNSDLEVHIIPREQIAKENAKTLTLDGMIKSLAEYKIRMKDQETVKL